VKGTVTIDGQIYKAFEMFNNGPWKIVKGTKYSDPSVAERIKAKSGKEALTKWLEYDEGDETVLPGLN
jgi:hypothetical protein